MFVPTLEMVVLDSELNSALNDTIFKGSYRTKKIQPDNAMKLLMISCHKPDHIFLPDNNPWK